MRELLKKWRFIPEGFPEKGGYRRPRVWSHADPDAPQIVCTVATREEMGAIGDLIAAAPEMRDAIAEMVADKAFGELCESIGDEPSWLPKARAALANAGGAR